MRVILAEKPSVAQSIAAVLGVNQKKNGYLQGENDIVSWCIGHLIELAPPEIYDARYAKWRREDLPIVPSAWESVVSDGTKKQFAVLKDLLNRTDVDEVVCATDAGREGEQKAKSLYPTEKAAALIAVLPENLRSPMMTAQWEQRLKRIEHGQEEAAGFMDDIVRMVTELVQSAQPVPDAQKLFPSDRPSVGTCPCCGAVVTETAKGFFCESRICRFGIWKDNRFFAQIGQSVNKSVVEALIRDGAAKLKGLRSKKTGRRYDATLKMMCGEQGVPRFQMEFEREK